MCNISWILKIYQHKIIPTQFHYITRGPLATPFTRATINKFNSYLINSKMCYTPLPFPPTVAFLWSTKPYHYLNLKIVQIILHQLYRLYIYFYVKLDITSHTCWPPCTNFNKKCCYYTMLWTELTFKLSLIENKCTHLHEYWLSKWFFTQIQAKSCVLSCWHKACII